jgi:hypothetical protein
MRRRTESERRKVSHPCLLPPTPLSPMMTREMPVRAPPGGRDVLLHPFLPCPQRRGDPPAARPGGALGGQHP